MYQFRIIERAKKIRSGGIAIPSIILVHQVGECRKSTNPTSGLTRKRWGKWKDIPIYKLGEYDAE